MEILERMKRRYIHYCKRPHNCETLEARSDRADLVDSLSTTTTPQSAVTLHSISNCSQIIAQILENTSFQTNSVKL